MAIKIHTYSDPYKLDQEPFWNEIAQAPYFTASQVLANGLSKLYGSQILSTIRPVSLLIDELFPAWNSRERRIKQFSLVDSILLNMEANQKYDLRLLQTMELSVGRIVKAIRTMIVLNLSPEKLTHNALTAEQKVLLDIYNQVLKSAQSYLFEFPGELIRERIDQAIDALQISLDTDLNYQTIVIHGIYKFSPEILKLISILSRDRDVILLFNYQNSLNHIYNPWHKIYSCFGAEIKGMFNGEKDSEIQKGNLYGSLIRLMNGKPPVNDDIHGIELQTYSNETEFINYVASLYRRAQLASPKSPLSLMDEIFFSADPSLNEKLKAYFPEQGDSRGFLEYPIGRFFLSIVNMWDTQEQRVVIQDLNDIKECLAVISRQPSRMNTLFSQCLPLFAGAQDIEEMASRIGSVKRRIERAQKSGRHSRRGKDPEKTGRISYYNLNPDDLVFLQNGLRDLDRISREFFADFQSNRISFRKFYQKLTAFLKEGSFADDPTFSEEYREILRRVLGRLSQLERVDAYGSVNCLKETMVLYLADEEQDEKPEKKKGSLIIRNFEQIEGDILLTPGQKSQKVYHFAALSDENLNKDSAESDLWPLDFAMLEHALDSSDWQLKVYLNSLKESSEYKKFALFYAMEFSQVPCRFSYIKLLHDHQQTVYYPFKMLNIPEKPFVYSPYMYKKYEPLEVAGSQHPFEFDQYDALRYNTCPYRFLIESVVQGKTIFTDHFMLQRYLQTLVSNDFKADNRGQTYSAVLLEDLMNKMDSWSDYFPGISEREKADLIHLIENECRRLRVLPNKRPDEEIRITTRELFLPLPEVVRDRIYKHNQEFSGNPRKEITPEELKGLTLSSGSFGRRFDECKFCPVKKICLEDYKYEMDQKL